MDRDSSKARGYYCSKQDPRDKGEGEWLLELKRRHSQQSSITKTFIQANYKPFSLDPHRYLKLIKMGLPAEKRRIEGTRRRGRLKWIAILLSSRDSTSDFPKRNPPFFMEKF